MTDHLMSCSDMRKALLLVEQRNREAEWTFAVR